MTFHTMGVKPLRIRSNKIDGFIKIHNKIKYLVLFDECSDKICDRIKYLLSKKSCITDNVNHNFTIIRIDLYDSLPIEKILTFHYVIILIKSVVNKYKNYYYCGKNSIQVLLYYTDIICYISLELRFLKGLMLIKQTHQKSVIFVTIFLKKL